MRIHLLDTGFFKLDGGAMFGVVPKSIWHKLNPVDDNNMCTWAKRCWLIEDGDSLTLVDTGMGDKQSEKFFGHYYLHGEASLHGSIKAAGYHPDEITDVFITHMHFDHVGGAVSWNKDHTAYVPTFKKARYWSNRAHYDWATHPNPREKASFLKENIKPLVDHQVLYFIEPGEVPDNLPFSELIFVDGHTEKQMLPIVDYKGQKMVFMADLLPSAHHIKGPYVMAYDVRPLDTMKEKAEFLDRAYKEEMLMVFQHDKDNQAGLLTAPDERGRYGIETSPDLADLMKH